jgi:uncharacterized CHY-type Zn-finger protein
MIAKCNMNPDLPEVRGIDVDPQTRCAHFHKPVDIIAIKMKCCGVYYACKDCHVALADHAIKVWPRTEWDHEAVLCGACGSRMTIGGYLKSGYRCPACQAEFNPACHNHHHYYFEREL